MAAPHNEQHTEETSFIKTPKQLITVVVLAFVIPITVIAILASLVLSKPRYNSEHPAMTDEAIAQRIKPVGDVLLASAAGAAGGAAAGAKSGEEVYKTVCAACHGTGALNAPKTGDNAAWAKLIPEGLEALTRDAIKGIRQMPPRGGNPDLSDVEVQRAVVFMANQSGASWKEPAAPAPAAAAAPAEDKAPAGAPAQTAAVDGKAVYDKFCMACHAAGVAGAPKTGDKAAWASRLKQGMDALYTASIKGKGAMPPKGGGAELSDDQVKAAVDYLIGQAK
jgi:cytochrome c5